MDEHYKEKFHDGLKSFIKEREDLQNLKSTALIDKENMNQALTEFLQKTFGEKFMKQLSDQERLKMVQSMMAFTFAHRHEKDDLFIAQTKQEGSIDFTIVRDVMYKYSKKSKETFFSGVFETFYFLKFASSKAFEEQLLKKNDVTPEKRTRLMKENQNLVAAGMLAINEMSKDNELVKKIVL